MTAPAIAQNPPLAMRGVDKRFGGVNALRGVDFDLEHGKVHVLHGEIEPPKGHCNNKLAEDV